MGEHASEALMATANFYGIGAEQQLAQLLAEQQRLQQEVDQPMSAASGQPLQTGRYLTLNFDRLRAAEERRRKQQELENLKKRSLDVQGEWQKGLVEELRKYKVAREGEVKELPGPTEDGGPLQGRTQGNPLAFRDFLTSPYSSIRQLADSDEKRLKDVFDKAAPKASLGSITGSDGVPQRLTPQDKWEYKDGAWFNAAEGGPPRLNRPVTQETLPGGTLANRTASGSLDSVDKAPKTDITVGSKANELFLGERGKSIAAAKDKLSTQLPRQLNALDRVEEVAGKGLIQGPVKNFATFAAGLMTQFGFAPEEVKQYLARTEVADAGMAEFVRAVLRDAGVNPSNTDLKFAQLAAGSTQNSPEGLRQLVLAARADLVNAVLVHNKGVEELVPQMPSLKTAIVPVEGRRLQVPGYVLGPSGLLEVAPGRGTPSPVPPSRGESALRGQAALSPAEQARSNAFERSPANIAELRAAIAAERDPGKRQVLEQLLSDLQAPAAPPPSQGLAPGRLEELRRKYGGGR